MEIDDIVTCYFRLGFRNKEILQALAYNHRTVISIRTLKRITKRLSLYRRKNNSDLLYVALFITKQCQESGSQHGYKWMHSKCVLEGFKVTQENVRLLLQVIDPDGVKIRSKRRLRRRAYCSRGPNAVWHIDGYSKTMYTGAP